MARDSDTLAEPPAVEENPFDRVTALAAALFKAPIAAVSLVDGDCYALSSVRGAVKTTGSTEDTFSRHVLALGPHAVLAIPDTLADPRMRENPHVVGPPYARFCAGAVITTADGRNLGAVAVADMESRDPPSAEALDALRMLARIAADICEELEAARRQDERLQTLEMAEAIAGIGHWRWDVLTNVVTWSDQVHRIHGRDPAVFDSSLSGALGGYHPEDQATLKAKIANALVTGEGYECRLRITRPDGEERVARTKARCERDDEGKVTALFGVLQDITEAVRAHEQVARSEALFRMMSETSTDIIARYGPDAKFTYLSPSVQTILGRTPEEMLGRRGAEFMHPDDRAATYARFMEFVNEGPGAPPTHIEYRALRPDGAVVWMEASPRAIRDEAGAVVEMHDHVRDITARKAAEREQAEMVDTLKMAEAMSGVGRWRLDLASGHVDWSDEVYRIFGYAAGSVNPTALFSAGPFHPDDNAMLTGLVAHSAATGAGYECRLRLTRPDGDERITVTKAACELDENGIATALFGVFQDITETVRMHEQAARSDALFRLMSETSADIVARYKPDGEILYLSPAIQTVLGRTPEGLVGKNCADIIHPDDVLETFGRMAALLAAEPGAHSLVEYRALHADGSVIWLEASPRAVRDEHGRIVEVHDHVRDITQHKAAQREQTKMVETLKLAETMAGVGQWRWDVLTNVVIWSDEVYRIHGLSPAEFNPSLDSAVGAYHPDDQVTLKAMIDHALSAGEGYECRLRINRADGAERIVEASARCEVDEQGRVHALFGVFQDVTDREQAVERIRHSEARYRLMADHASDIIGVCDLKGVFSYISPAIETVLGYRPDEVIGNSFDRFMHPDDVKRTRAAYVAYVAAGPGAPSPRVLYRALRKAGGTVWLEAHPKLIRDETGRPLEFRDQARDVSETKLLEAELIEARDRAEKSAQTKSEFLANMSHELRTPLTSVIGFSGLLQGSPNLPDAERKYADRIATSSEALLSVINDILDYSKLEAEAVDLEPQPFDPVAMARGAAMILETQCLHKGLILVVEAAADLPQALMGDEGRLRQVTLNFLSNAVKFTASGEIRLALSMTEGRLRVAVTDQGIGIAADKIEQLFDRFTQVDASTTRIYGGTGLGLAISHRLIGLMGGQIGAESRPGEGSTFWFEVPLEVAGTTGTADINAGAIIPGSTRILMADDAPANRELVTALLSGLGLELETVSDGAEAVEAARTGAYDLILMDVHMPVMDGLDATRAIRAMEGPAATTPIIALTANVQPEHVERCLAAGMDGHVGKPIQVSDLLTIMAVQLNSRRVRPGGDVVAA